MLAERLVVVVGAVMVRVLDSLPTRPAVAAVRVLFTVPTLPVVLVRVPPMFWFALSAGVPMVNPPVGAVPVFVLAALVRMVLFIVPLWRIASVRASPRPAVTLLFTSPMWNPGPLTGPFGCATGAPGAPYGIPGPPGGMPGLPIGPSMRRIPVKKRPPR